MSLVKLPDDALMFPNPPAPGESFSLPVPCNPRNTTKEFVRKAVKLGFKALWLHDLRGSHETCLAGVPVYVVAPRCGHDPGSAVADLRQAYAQGGRAGGRSDCGLVQGGARGLRPVGSNLGPM